MRFEFSFNLIGKSTMAFSAGQSWRVLKSWYTGGSPEEGFRRSLADGLNQSVVSSVAQARSLVHATGISFKLEATYEYSTAIHSTAQTLFSPASRQSGCAQTFSPLSSFVGGKFFCGQLSMDRIQCGCPRENVECGPETTSGTQRQYLSDSEIYPKIQLSKSSRSKKKLLFVYWLTFWNVWPSHVFDDSRSTCLLTLGVNSKCVSHTAPSKWPKYSSWKP